MTDTKIIADDVKIRAGEVPVSTSDNSTVKLLSDVVGGSISIDEIEGNPFVNNVLGADGDALSSSNSSVTSGLGTAAELTDRLLLRTEVLTITGNFYPSLGYAGSKFYESTIRTAVGTYFTFLAPESSWTGGNTLIRSYTAAGNSATANLSVYNLSTFGIITPTQYATRVGQGVTGMTLGTSTWSDIAYQLTDAILAEWIPEHKSGYMPSIMDSVVNRGGNLAYFDGNKLNQNGRPDNSGSWEYVDGKILITSGGISTANKLGFAIPIEPNTKYSFSWSESGTEATNGMFIMQHSAYPVDATNTDTLVATANISTSSLYTVTSEVNARYFVVSFDVGGTPPSVGAYIGPIQLNKGATAFDYTEPLNDVKTFGQRSPNLLINGNGENGVLGYVNDPSSGVVITYAGGYIQFDTTADAILVRKDISINEICTLSLVAKRTTTTVYLFAYCDEGDLLQDGGLSWAWNAAGYYQLPITSASDFDVFGVFSKITQLGFYRGTTTSDIYYIKELMLVKGSYTLAQLQALGYQSYNPVVLHAVSDGSQMYYDKVKSIDNTLSIEQNVDSTDYTYGDPEINETPVYESVFTATVDGWTAVRQTAAVGIDPLGGADNTWYRLTADTSNNTHYLYKDNLTIGMKYKVTCKYYIPSGQTSLVAMVISDGSQVQHSGYNTFNTLDAETTATFIFDAPLSTARLAFFSSTGTTFSFLDAGGDDVMYIKDIVVQEFNIQQKLVPTIEDISEFAPPLSLAANVGNNHVVSSFGGAVFTVQSYTTLAGMQEMIKDLQYSKADRDELPIPESLSIVTTAGIGAGLSVYYSYHLIGGMPDVVKGAFQADVNNYHANVASVEFWDNGVVVTANGSGVAASAVLFTQKIGTSNPFISYTGV